MRYTIMHKNISVLDIDIDEDTASIAKIYDIYNIEHLPVGVGITAGRPDRKSLYDWWIGRSIPVSRSGLRDALMAMNISSPLMLPIQSFGLSLSDQYWARRTDNPIQWSDVNFFENGYSKDVGNVLFGKVPEGELDLMSPDNTSDGWLKKKWVIADGKRMLIKGGSGPFYQEPLNESLATAIAKRLNIPHAVYKVIWEDEQPLSACEDFITTSTDLVSAWRIIQTRKKANDISAYRHFLLCCEQLGIPDMESSLDKMITLDYLMVNSDRHYNNFGAVRNAETLEWIGAAPIFDCGTSMWYDQFTHMIRHGADAPSKPFKSKHSEQIKLVTDFDWIDFNALRGVEEECSEILRPSPHIDDARRDTLCCGVQARVKMLESEAVRK